MQDPTALARVCNGTYRMGEVVPCAQLAVEPSHVTTVTGHPTRTGTAGVSAVKEWGMAKKEASA